MQVDQAVADVKNTTPRQYVFIGDYCQNMEVPFLGSEQPGKTRYLTPCSVFCFGMVNVAHRFDDDIHTDEVGNFMHAYAHEEWNGKKVGKYVASLVMKGLRDLGLLNEDEQLARLTKLFDSCSGQKKNTVLRLVPYFVE